MPHGGDDRELHAGPRRAHEGASEERDRVLVSAQDRRLESAPHRTQRDRDQPHRLGEPEFGERDSLPMDGRGAREVGRPPPHPARIAL